MANFSREFEYREQLNNRNTKIILTAMSLDDFNKYYYCIYPEYSLIPISSEGACHFPIIYVVSFEKDGMYDILKMMDFFNNNKHLRDLSYKLADALGEKGKDIDGRAIWILNREFGAIRVSSGVTALGQPYSWVYT